MGHDNFFHVLTGHHIMYITLIPPSLVYRLRLGLYALWRKELRALVTHEAPMWEVFGGNGSGRSAYTRPLTTT